MKNSSIIDVKSIVENKKQELKEEIVNLKNNNVFPKLAVILANNEESSKIYIGKKRKMCEELGIEEIEYILDEKVTNEEVIDIINKLNNDETIDGILVQLPIFKHLNQDIILNNISPEKDVDGFHPVNLGKLIANQSDGIVPCTPKGIMMILDSLNIDIQGKDAVVVGRSIIVGKPIAQLLLNRGATVTTCHSKTTDLKKHTKRADILVVATGVPHLVTSEMVKEDSVVIDVGINRIDGKICGDVDTDNVSEIVEYITPVPGGVGITTVISLMDNLVEIARNRNV